MNPKQAQRRPWRMRWIVLSIALFVPVYTYLTLHYRRPGPAFQPYADLRDRTNVVRLLKAGYHRVAVDAVRPAEPQAAGSPAAGAAPGGLPQALRQTLVETPPLPLEITSAFAARETSGAFDYTVLVGYTLADNRHQLSGAHLYLREGELVLVPDFEPIAGSLQARSREGQALLTVPPAALRPGTYQVTVVGERQSRAWTLTVR